MARPFPFLAALLPHLVLWLAGFIGLLLGWEWLDSLSLAGASVMALVFWAIGLFGLQIMLREDEALERADRRLLWRRYLVYSGQLIGFLALAMPLMYLHALIMRGWALPVLRAIIPDEVVYALGGLLIFLLLGAAGLGAMFLGAGLKKVLKA